MQGAQQLGRGIEDYAAGAQKAKAMRQLVKAYAPEGDQGDALTNWADTASIGDLEGFVEQHAAQSAMKKAATQEKMMLAQLENYGAQADLRKQQAVDDQTAGAFLQNFLTTPATRSGPNGEPIPLTPMERLNLAATKTPNMSGKILPKVMDSLARWQQLTEKEDGGTPPEFTVNTNAVPGVSLVALKGSKQWQGFQTAGPQTTLVDDGQGGKVPVVSNARGQITQIKPANKGLSEEALLKSYDAQERALMSNFELSPQDKAEKLAELNDARDTIRNRGKGGATPPAAASLPTATNPKTGEKLVFKDGKWQPLK